MKTKFIFLAILIMLSADSASACMCLPVSACETYEKVPAIFIASVTEVDPPSNGVEDLQYAHLSVEHTFKGTIEAKVRFLQGSPGLGCSFIFEKGERYLLYAMYDKETKNFYTNTCTRSRPLRYAAEDIDYLRGLPFSNEVTRLSGTVIKSDYYEESGNPSVPELIRGVKVIAEGENGQRFEAVTNDQGFYKIVGLPSGRYKVTAEIPPYLSHDTDKPPFVDVPNNGCVTAEFLTRTDGRISGVVLDRQGRVMPETDVDLIPFELADRVGDRIGRYKKTDKTGGFEFTELLPGRYLLGVNIRQEPDGDNPFQRTYFPGVSNVAEAKVITLGKGEKLKGHLLRLPPPLPVRIIRGRFVWQDGRPVTKALLQLKDTAELKAGGSLDFAEVDSQGRFSLKALEGKEVWVHGSVTIRVGSGLDIMVAEPVRVKPNSKPGTIRLIVSRNTDGGVRIIP